MKQLKPIGEYPDNWKDIAIAVKDAANWHCVRCGHKHEIATGHMLTVHHLDMNKSNCEWWNIVPLCQRCHLSIQARVIMPRPWAMGPHSEWFKPYVAGYYASVHGMPTDREYVMANIAELLAIGQGVRFETEAVQ